MLVAGLICVGFACGDEYHQSFVEGRGPSIHDVGIDSIGVFAGISCVRIVCWTFLAPARMMERSRIQRERRLGPSGGKYPDDEDGGYYEDEYGDYDDYDEDYPEEEGMRLDRLPAMPPEDAYPDDDYDGYDPYEDDRAPEDTGYVDEQNMNLIAASTESEDEEDADFDAIFREIERTRDKDGRY